MKCIINLKSFIFAFASLMLLCNCGGSDDIDSNNKPNPGGSSGSGSSTTGKALSENLTVKDLYEAKIKLVGIPAGNYSGISPIEDGKYVVADDKAFGASFVIMEFETNPETGSFISGKRTIPAGTDMSFYENGVFDWNALIEAGKVVNDAEGIVYYPKKKTVFITTEEAHYEPRVVEYTIEGKATGREFDIPRDIVNGNTIQEGYGFESLAYNEKTGLFWTTTEKSLIADMKEGDKSALCRLLCFDENLKFKTQYLYRTDDYLYETGEPDPNHIWGITDILALDDGRLIVMERDFDYPTCDIALYVVNPTKAKEGEQLEKKLIYTNKGKGEVLADYEGICFGPTLSSGVRTLYLIADSDNGNIFFNERIKVLSIE